MSNRAAVVLFSGGLDSATALAVAQSKGFGVSALSFRYGQRHAVELAAAERFVQTRGVARHAIVEIDLAQFGGSALTTAMDVPKGRMPETMPAEIPLTYVPARNTVFLSLALAFAETIGAFDIFIGANALDYSGYPDCRPEYLAAFERMANLATKASVEGSGRFRIHAPLLHMTKAEIILRGVALGIDYAMTHSCYDPGPAGEACGACDSCLLRLKGFCEAGMIDPVRYAGC